MAYTALVSLSQTIDRILVHEPYLLLFEKETLVSLHKNVDALLTFVEEYWNKCRGVANPLESRIISAAYQAEDLIEYHIDDVINPISICKQEPKRRPEAWTRLCICTGYQPPPGTRVCEASILLLGCPRLWPEVIESESSNPPCEIHILNKFQSWTLFEERVFGKGSSCPSELEQIGKKVAERCKGHHLTIAVIAKLLKRNITKEYWESISENISLLEPTIELDCMKYLWLTYYHLPLYLKPYFLYVTTFLETISGNEEIRASNLIRLWIAEGFVKRSESMPLDLEEVGEGYLHDLVERNLLIARYNNYNIIKTITIPTGIVGDFGTLIARHEKFLDNPSQKNLLESQMSDTLYQAECITENQFYWPEPERNFASLRKVLRDTDLILEEATEVINNNPAENVLLLENFSTETTRDINNMVLKDDFMLIKDRIYNNSCNFQIIPIVGMGGIGKSTLARKLYEDSINRHHFDRCIWIVVSQYYSPRKLLVDIMLSIGMPIIDKHTGKECDDMELRKRIYQELYGRRYMIVVDDLWSVEAWDDLNLILPTDTTGSRVLVTTRLSEIARYVGSSSNPPYEKQLLNGFQSWRLFEERVFGKVFSCPFELEQIGREVVKGCRGLPLTIVVVAGLLKGHTTKEYWESISKYISSSEPTFTQLHCSNVLSLSYNHLPLYLRPCFLYVTSFPEDYEIRANRLIRFWIAEGFVKPNGPKCLEEVAYGYLHDLVGRSLLMVSKKDRYNERIKTIRVHDLLRDFGTSTAQQERFHYYDDLKPEYRRITPRDSVSLHLFLKCYKPATRSILMPDSLFGYEEHSFENLRLLRVLDAYMGMKGDASSLVHLRYLSIHYADNTLLNSISKFRNIETLIIHVHKECVIPLNLWKNPSLRHLILPSLSRLEQPYEDGIYEETSLQTIRSVTNLRLTKKIVEMLLNIRKLKIRYEPVSCDRINLCSEYDFINLVHLQKLEKLTIGFPAISIPYISDLAFPKTLKKLSLSFIKGLWKDMRVVGSLPNLQVFKLSWSFSKGGAWEPIEGQFLKLRHLKFEHVRLDHWEAESGNFPNLEILVLKCIEGELNDIPYGIGEIDTLKVIKLARCDESIVDSAKQIQADQWEVCNTDLQLLVSPSRRYNKEEQYKVIRPEGY